MHFEFMALIALLTPCLDHKCVAKLTPTDISNNNNKTGSMQ